MGIFRRRRPAQELLPAPGGEKPSMVARALSRVIERSERVQGPAVRAYVERLRHSEPGTSPAQVVTKLEKRYLAAATASGAAVGATAAVPAIGTLLALSAIAGETAVFLEATAFFVLSVAEVHGIPVDNRERRRALVLAVLVGDKGKGAMAELLGAGRTSGAWLTEGTAAVPLPAVSELNSRLLRYFVKRFTLRRGALAFGKLLPVGLGAVIGALGNRMMGKKIVGNARKAFGPAADRWPVTLHLLPALHDNPDSPASPAQPSA
ncbi:hypothetical protein MTER_28830 [Mycolicibacter terrae]|jgi:hypothetical protein|uniref:Uncharacterized protein n=1 Tax=Mycolicibacter terrae TaxID=1788 RepID=A0AAD1MGC3_9MYCO|nr:hypothetical protein [Mycolicibacter terrae]ORW91609.1 hypothetical protein AWC28_17915 [Mycolicibacter terrae]BBX23472.1 hypothetical protein MTER_28830 [Mycolicibacter terrae]SNV63491.1 membrane protein [Mycolicibacter terrae]